MFSNQTTTVHFVLQQSTLKGYQVVGILSGLAIVEVLYRTIIRCPQFATHLRAHTSKTQVEFLPTPWHELPPPASIHRPQ